MSDPEEQPSDVPPTSEAENEQAEVDWEENEPSPHQGEQGQESEL
jgi:hypothetical protein